MSVRDPSSDSLERTVARSGIAPPTKYDLLLAAVPILLLAGTLGGRLLSLPTPAGAGLGSLAAAVLVGYGLFVVFPADCEASRGDGQ